VIAADGKRIVSLRHAIASGQYGALTRWQLIILTWAHFAGFRGET
jgi:hypothetical protein